MAIRFADFATGFCDKLSYVSIGKPLKGVHLHWDNQVIWAPRNPRYLKIFRESNQIVWFGVDMVRLEESCLCRGKAQQVLVPLWGQQYSTDPEVYDLFDVVIAPSKNFAAYIQESWLASLVNRASVFATSWNSGLPLTTSEGPSEEKSIKVYMALSPRTIGNFGGAVPTLCYDILNKVPNCRLTVTHFKSWKKPTNGKMQKLRSEHPHRFSMVHKPSWHEHVSFLDRNDWFIWLATSTSSDIMVSQAVARGAPVLAFDVAPSSESLKDGVNATLLPCELDIRKGKPPRAVPDFDRLSRSLESNLTDQDKLCSLQSKLKFFQSPNEHEFHDLWIKLWKLCS